MQPFKRRQRNPSAAEKPLSASDECDRAVASIGEKADKNKKRARVLTLAMTVCTASIPLFIGLSGDSFWFGKVTPSVLAALSAVLVAINQLERPHERWVLYRRYQRLLQAEEKRFRFGSPPYGDVEQGERMLAMQVAQLELDLQSEWEGLIPTRAEITATGATAGSGRS